MENQISLYLAAASAGEYDEVDDVDYDCVDDILILFDDNKDSE